MLVYYVSMCTRDQTRRAVTTKCLAERTTCLRSPVSNTGESLPQLSAVHCGNSPLSMVYHPHLSPTTIALPGVKQRGRLRVFQPTDGSRRSPHGLCIGAHNQCSPQCQTLGSVSQLVDSYCLWYTMSSLRLGGHNRHSVFQLTDSFPLLTGQSSPRRLQSSSSNTGEHLSTRRLFLSTHILLLLVVQPGFFLIMLYINAGMPRV